jgi:peptidyl-prolyl cis-trans isomerase D
MMETIRTAANNIFVKIIFAIIILCFIFTGVGFLGFSGGNSPRDQQLYIAKVDGEGISRAEFEAQARAVTAKAGGDSSFIKQIRRNVLSHQIDNYLAYKFSQSIGVAISNDQIKKFIKKQRDFFKNGKFDNQTYLNLLAENHFTPDSYAEIIRTVLQQQQTIDAIVNSGFVLPNDSEIDSLKNQTRSVYATLVDTSIGGIDELNVTLDDEQKYYDEHPKEFFKSERVKVKYIVASEDLIRKTIVVTESDLRNEYDKNIKNYSYPAKKAYSIIFVTDKEQANKIAKELSSGADFEKMVKTINQQDNHISPYGEKSFLGWFADDDSLPKFLKDAKLNKVGKTSLPIAVDDGYVIVKLDGMQPKKFMDYDYAKYQIDSKLAKQKIQQALEKQEKMINAALKKSPKSIEELAEKVGLEVRTSDWITFNDKFSIASHPEVRDVIFSDEMIVDEKATNKISDLITADRNYGKYDFVVQTVDYRPEGIAPFDEVKDEIHKKLFAEMAKKQFKSNIDNILVQLNEKGSAKNVQFAKKYTLHRNSTEIDQNVVNMVFNLHPLASGKPVYGAELLDDKTAYIVALTKVDTPKEYKDISSELLPILLNDMHYYLATDIRSKAKIEIMPDANL